MKGFIAVLIAVAVSLAGAGPVAAHVHHVHNPSHSQPLANGQNHSPFVFDATSGMFASCGEVDPAGYGLETAHHGPDRGTPGSADGCYALATPPAQTDNNPAID